MEQILQNEHVIALIGAIALALGVIVTALARRAVRAIEEWGALNAEERRRGIADEVTAAVEMLCDGAEGTQKLLAAQRMAREYGMPLATPDIEAALKRAEGTWRQPAWVGELDQRMHEGLVTDGAPDLEMR